MNQSSIQIEDTVTEEINLLNPLTSILRISSDKIFTLFDEARGESFVLGKAIDLVDEKSVAIGDFDAVIDYVAGILGKPVGDVFLQDQYSEVLDVMFGINVRNLQLAASAVIDIYTLTVVDTTGITVGNYIGMQEGLEGFQGQILLIVGNVITLDTPLDYSFSTNCFIYEGKQNLNVDGSITAAIARIKPRPGFVWDITRISINMIHSLEADDSKFGGIAALTRGIVVRKSNGVRHTIFNAKTNGQLRERCQNVIYTNKAGGGAYGVNAYRVFSGQENNGVVVRLDGDKGDQLEIFIQDNLTGLTSFRAIAQGHVVI